MSEVWKLKMARGQKRRNVKRLQRDLKKAIKEEKSISKQIEKVGGEKMSEQLPGKMTEKEFLRNMCYDNEDIKEIDTALAGFKDFCLEETLSASDIEKLLDTATLVHAYEKLKK